jgi:hypothetical protein
MKKFYYIFAAGLFMASCANEEIVTQEPITPTESAIVFGSVRKGMTRADATGADAATLLGNKFVVSGYKGNQTAFSTTDPKSNIVFDNYLVEYKENTANTTESNSTNWEYVGVANTPIKHATDNGITSQQIKYWDYSKPQYDFIAWSTGSKTAIYEGTPAAGKVLVSAITPDKATGTGTDKVAYTFTGTADDLSACYIADLVTVKKAKYGDNPVEFKFRQLGTKVRIAIYETVPGYSVKDVKFYTKDGVLDADATDPTKPADGQIVNNATIFSTDADIYTEGTYTVSFPTVDTPSSDDNNQAHVTFAPKTGVAQTTIVDWGGLNYTIAEEGEKTTGNVFLGRSSSTASYAGDPATNYYVIYMPNETGTNLNLRVDYTLESIDGSGEEIFVKNSKTQVPGIYTTWKPGFAYTYLFKISDKTNGRTGVYDPTQADDATVNSDPAGLYPITFDAVVVNAEDNDATQETITTIATPSITTYQQASTVVNADEYKTGKDIFVTVNEGDALVTLTGKAALYTIPAGKTEAEVVDALQMQDDDAATSTVKGRSGLVLTNATSTLTNSVEFGTDGNAISVATDQALRFTPTANTTYAFVYTKTAPTAANDVVKYQALNWAKFEAGQTKYRYDYKAPAATDAQKGVKYFKEDAGVYTMQTPFIGQGVSNLYLDAAGNTIASGYAVTGTTYYYTLDKGQTYKAAHNVAYADFAAGTATAADLFTFDGTTYTAKTDAAPVDGTAYYQRTGEGTATDPYVYTYCVILPQQTTGWFELDTTKYVVATETAEVVGQTYFDKYTKNDGEYYTKVIKVQ